MPENDTVSCSKCSAVWQSRGTTNCWSGDPATAPARPGNCPTDCYGEVVQQSFDEYRGDSEDARIAFVAGQVEGMCYQPVPGSDAVNARWTRVEDTIAFAKLMGYKKIGIATCIGMLEEAERLSLILKVYVARRGVLINWNWVCRKATRCAPGHSNRRATRLPRLKSATGSEPI